MIVESQPSEFLVFWRSEGHPGLKRSFGKNPKKQIKRPVDGPNLSLLLISQQFPQAGK